MRANTRIGLLSVTCIGVLMTACSEGGTPPTDLVEPVATQLGMANVVLPEPFTRRAPLDPFFINQPSDMMIRSTARTDLAIQRLVTPPGVGGWHTHPGPSFGIVDEGEVMITRATKRGCVSTVYRKGDAYFEVAGEVHRASVLGEATAVEYKVRFFTPVGEPFAQPAPAPRC